MTDYLEMWWQWPVLVQRFAGDGSNGPTFEGATEHKAKITQKRKLVRNADGEEVVSEARISLPALIPLIPVRSLVTFPAEFGGRQAEVLAEQLHHSGTDMTPNFYSIDLT